jgi:hypothetical protein
MSNLTPKFRVGQIVLEKYTTSKLYCSLITEISSTKIYNTFRETNEFLYYIDAYKIEKGKMEFYGKGYEYYESELQDYQETIDKKIENLELEREELLRFNDAIFNLQNHKEEINGK